jgi:hypothetical protein
MVNASVTIQSLVVPREPRADSPANPLSLSWEEAMDADSLCQNSEVAMFVLLTSNVQKLRERAGNNFPTKES